jgi:hypothetical protein
MGEQNKTQEEEEKARTVYSGCYVACTRQKSTQEMLQNRLF